MQSRIALAVMMVLARSVFAQNSTFQLSILAPAGNPLTGQMLSADPSRVSVGNDSPGLYTIQSFPRYQPEQAATPPAPALVLVSPGNPQCVDAPTQGSLTLEQVGSVISIYALNVTIAANGMLLDSTTNGFIACSGNASYVISPYYLPVNSYFTPLDPSCFPIQLVVTNVTQGSSSSSTSSSSSPPAWPRFRA